MATTAVHVGRYEFDHFAYDRRGDVLYLARRLENPAADTFGTHEGHAVRLDKDGEVVGITIVNAKWLLERDGEVKVTVLSLMETDPGDLEKALAVV